MNWMIQNWTTGELNALVKNLGGEEVARKIQKGEVKVSLEEAIKMLFDKSGRRIPQGLTAEVCDPDLDFGLYRLQEIDYNRRLQLLRRVLRGVDTGINAECFQQEAERQLALIRDNSQIANIIDGVWLPVIMPQLTTEDLGEILENYVEAAGKSYIANSYRRFYNRRKGTSAGKIYIVDESRYDQFIGRMKQGAVIGIYFPKSLQGFSINACREQITELPEGFILSGLDTIIAMIMYPDILARGYRTLSLCLAALSWQSADFSLEFDVDNSRLNFGSTAHLVNARGAYSGGLLFVG